MTVGELIRELADMPPQIEVFFVNHSKPLSKAKITQVLLENNNDAQWVMLDDYVSLDNNIPLGFCSCGWQLDYEGNCPNCTHETEDVKAYLMEKNIDRDDSGMAGTG